MNKAEAIIIKEPLNFKQDYIYTDLIVKYGNKMISLKAGDKFRFNHNGSIHESDNIKKISDIIEEHIYPHLMQFTILDCHIIEDKELVTKIMFEALSKNKDKSSIAYHIVRPNIPNLKTKILELNDNTNEFIILL